MINILLTELNASKITNFLSQNITTTKIINGKKRKFVRELLGDVPISNSAGNSLNIKFIEKIRIGSVSNGKWCIAFGYNPAYGDPNKIDDSNAYLIGLFEHCYEGYYLINLFPDVACSIKNLNIKTNYSIELKKSLIAYANNAYKQYDLYIFAGPRFDTKNYVFYYDALKFYNVFTLSDKNDKLKHISALKHGAKIHKVNM